MLPLTLVSSPVAHGDDDVQPLEIGPAGRFIIEIAGVCQARCPYCAQNSGKARRAEKAADKPTAYMSVDLFRQTLARIRKSDAYLKGRVDRVYLYNWGEPFLAPKFNEYLEMLKDAGLYAVVSSNFQKVPVIRKDLLPVINEVLFSTSGMTQETYGRIHGPDVKSVFANFEAFKAELNRYSPKAKIFMSWHRYRFNEHEFWDAYNYTRKHGFGFIPSVAFLNDLTELIQAASDKLTKERKQDAQRDMYFDHMVDSISSYKEGGSDYDCPAWDDVVVDEKGRLLICCGTDSATSVGNVLESNYEEMRQRKVDSAFCRACKKTGVAEWAHNNFHDHNQLPWPTGGGLANLRLKLTYNKLKIKSDIRHMLNNVAFGEALLGVYRKLKHA